PASDVLHADVRPPTLVADVEDLDDVGMAKASRDLSLTQEAQAKAGIAGEVVGEELDRDRPVELAVVCELDERHPAVPERPLEPVAPSGRSLSAQSFSLCCLP